MKTYRTSCIVIGTGCAGLNAADTLYEEGMTDVLLVTEGIAMGTSRNTGSDKQTYYKMALASDCVDGVGEMAQSYYACGGMSGELALTESANSLRCFYKLVSLGVPFVQNSYGEFPGYRTDHDQTKRATSAGPLTSRLMTEALERAVHKKGIPILDDTLVWHLFVRDGAICGALAWNKKEQDFVLLESPAVILATGGSALIYRDSVYPASQTGMSGMAIEAGAETANYTEWQYGLASTPFRWNVSGSYQQVMPRYISIDPGGREREFLADTLPPEEVLSLTFQKGYQWPFDSGRMNCSSKIDLLVQEQIRKGCRVYLDYRQNPAGFSRETMSREAYDYLLRSDALQETPVKRLRAMNEKAYQLFLGHGTDLEKEPLQVAVCAQHQNGGLKVDRNYQTCIEGLYAAGEAAGVFGIRRPGGSALNSTQVSSLCAARHIAAAGRRACVDLQDDARLFIERNIHLDSEKDILQKASREPDSASAGSDFINTLHRIQGKMSDYAAFYRDEEKIALIHKEVTTALEQCRRIRISCSQAVDFFKYRDVLITLEEILPAMLLWCREIGGRGGAATAGRKPNQEDIRMVLTKGGKAILKAADPVPASDTWFEKVYRKQKDTAAETGLVSVSFRQLAPEEILKTASCAGLRWMEWGSDIHVPEGNTEQAAQIKALTERYGLQCLSYGTYYKLGQNQSIEPFMQTARALGVIELRIWAGTKGSSKVSAGERASMVKEAKMVCNYAKRYGIRINFEYHPDTLTDCPESALLLMREIAEENCGLYWQPDYRKSEAENERALRMVLPYVKIIHLFFWEPDGTRKSLAEGDRKSDLLRTCLGMIRDRNIKVLLEFVENDDITVLSREAQTLFRILQRTAISWTEQTGSCT